MAGLQQLLFRVVTGFIPYLASASSQHKHGSYARSFSVWEINLKPKPGEENFVLKCTGTNFKDLYILIRSQHIETIMEMDKKCFR